MTIDFDLFENAFEFAPIGMALVSLDGKFLKVNQSLVELWGYDEEELLNIDFQTITHEEDLGRDLNLLHQLVDRKINSYRIEKRYFHKNGKTMWALLSVSLIRSKDGSPKFFISQILDITEIKNAQHTMVYNSKMIALGEMAAGIAHEINNPLAIIHLNAVAIEESLNDPNPDKKLVSSFLKKINDTVSRINGVVTSLRKLSRRSEEIHFEKCELELIVQDSLALCLEKFRISGVKLNKTVQNTMIECRPVEISQVLINLLNNAFYAVRNSEEKEIELIASHDGKKVRIEVSDSGPAIAPEIRAKIMEPFFTTKPLGEGTGLGLSISRNIIDSHKGTIVLCEKASRTTFVVEFPISQH
ncbi:sensor histidine kinase [Peredibacter starrii]|uniref:histidine kinase n=1 Tax=Peredibacter starrii TaxID=28202 RepID=A0AAX4HKB1_9BACT|nr:PAS domain S-box protein [Peredibacter starrii]WPU63663.1 PAS domain S-box protein [Peredibacter starrii]